VDILDLLEGLALALLPFIVLAIVVVVAALVVVNVIGKRLDKHADVAKLISLRLDNLHEERAKRHVQSLQLTHAPPPPLSEARTVEMPDDLRLTLERDPKNKKGGP